MNEHCEDETDAFVRGPPRLPRESEALPSGAAGLGMRLEPTTQGRRLAEGAPRSVGAEYHPYVGAEKRRPPEKEERPLLVRAERVVVGKLALVPTASHSHQALSWIA